MKTKEATQTEPLLFWEINDDTDRKNRNQTIKIWLIALVMFATGLGVSHMMKTMETTQGTPTTTYEEMVGAADVYPNAYEQWVGDAQSDDVEIEDIGEKEDDPCEDCVNKILYGYTLDICNNEPASAKVLKSVLNGCEDCTWRVIRAVPEICKELKILDEIELCDEFIEGLTKEDCEMPKEEMNALMIKMLDDGEICEHFIGSLPIKVEEKCATLGVDMDRIPDLLYPLTQEIIDNLPPKALGDLAEKIPDFEEGAVIEKEIVDMSGESKVGKQNEHGMLRPDGSSDSGCSFTSSLWNCIHERGPQDFFVWPNTRYIARAAVQAGLSNEHAPTGTMTELGITMHPVPCRKLCDEAVHWGQPNCAYNHYTGRCVVSNGARAATFYDDWLLAGLPAYAQPSVMKIKHYNGGGYQQYGEWGNTGTHHCADEGGYCKCHGVVTYVSKYIGHWPALSWNAVMNSNLGMVHMESRGLAHCTNGQAGRDPMGGEVKQCFCHPASHQTSSLKKAPTSSWTRESCKQRYVNKNGIESFFVGMITGMECTGLCTASVVGGFRAGSSVPVQRCSHACYCLAIDWGA